MTKIYNLNTKQPTNNPNSKANVLTRLNADHFIHSDVGKYNQFSNYEDELLFQYLKNVLLSIKDYLYVKGCIIASRQYNLNDPILYQFTTLTTTEVIYTAVYFRHINDLNVFTSLASFIDSKTRNKHNQIVGIIKSIVLNRHRMKPTCEKVTNVLHDIITNDALSSLLTKSLHGINLSETDKIHFQNIWNVLIAKLLSPIQIKGLRKSYVYQH